MADGEPIRATGVSSVPQRPAGEVGGGAGGEADEDESGQSGASPPAMRPGVAGIDRAFRASDFTRLSCYDAFVRTITLRKLPSELEARVQEDSPFSRLPRIVVGLHAAREEP